MPAIRSCVAWICPRQPRSPDHEMDGEWSLTEKHVKTYGQDGRSASAEVKAPRGTDFDVCFSFPPRLQGSAFSKSGERPMVGFRVEISVNSQNADPPTDCLYYYRYWLDDGSVLSFNRFRHFSWNTKSVSHVLLKLVPLTSKRFNERPSVPPWASFEWNIVKASGALCDYINHDPPHGLSMTDQARTGTPAYRELRAKHGSKPKRPDFQRIQPRPYQAEKRSTFFTQEKNLRHHYHHYRGGYSGNHYESELPRSSHQESMIASSGRYTDDALKYARFEAPNGHMDYRGMKRARESPAGPPGEPHYKYPKTIDDGQKSTRSYRDYGWNPNNDQSPLDRMRRETYPPRSPYSPFQHEQSPSPKLYTFKSPTILSRRTSPISSANPLSVQVTPEIRADGIESTETKSFEREPQRLLDDEKSFSSDRSIRCDEADKVGGPGTWKTQGTRVLETGTRRAQGPESSGISYPSESCFEHLEKGVPRKASDRSWPDVDVDHKSGKVEARADEPRAPGFGSTTLRASHHEVKSAPAGGHSSFHSLGFHSASNFNLSSRFTSEIDKFIALEKLKALSGSINPEATKVSNSVSAKEFLYVDARNSPDAPSIAEGQELSTWMRPSEDVGTSASGSKRDFDDTKIVRTCESSATWNKSTGLSARLSANGERNRPWSNQISDDRDTVDFKACLYPPSRSVGESAKWKAGEMESWARDRGAGWSPRSISSPQYADRPSPLFGRQANVIGHGGQRQRSFQLKSPRHSLNKDMREECRVGVSPYASGDRQRRRECELDSRGGHQRDYQTLATKEKDSMLKDKKATIPTELDRDIKGDSTDPSLEEGECYFENLEKKLNPHESGSVEPARRKDEPLPLDSREDKEALLRARLKATLEELARIEKEKADGQREDGNVAVDDAFDTYKNKNEETGKLGATRFESSQDVKMGVNRIKQPSGGEAVCFRKEVRNDGHTPPTGIQQGNGFAGTDLDNSSKRENSSKVSDESTSLQYASFCEKKGKDDGTMEEDPTIDASWPLGSA